jgi:putative membrane protein
MTIASLVLAGVAAGIHVLFFLMESVLFMREDVYRRFGAKTREEAATQRLFAFNQGFYNLFLAAGTVAGIAMASGNDVGRDWVLVAFGCAFMVGAALVLVVSERKMIRAAAIQGAAPAVALVLMTLA